MTTSATQTPGDEPESHHDQPHRRLVLAADLVTDKALEDANGDEFHHAAIAKAVGDLTLSSATPVNIALFGPWGSGKSTFYHLMANRIEQQDRKVVVVSYDAWKYGGRALKTNFIQDVARRLELKRNDFDRDLNLNEEQSRIRLGRWFRYNWTSFLGAAFVGLVIASLWTATHAAVDAKWLHAKQTYWEVLPSHVTEFGLVLAAVLTTLLLGPKALESAVVKTTRPAIERDDQFAQMFRQLVRRIKKEKDAHRVVFFIDELDRCDPADVVATLVDLKTFLDEPDCVFVVAADRDVLEHALREVPQAKPIRDSDPYYSTPGAFIDKIFQHQIALPPLRTHALSSFAHRLVSDRTDGLWKELQLADPTGRLFNDIVYILVPAHVSSPRRVKVLLNNFATNARIAQSRHIEWTDRARELAFLTVLETEFPTVAATLIHFPDLLVYLRGDKDPADESLPADRKAQVDRLNPANQSDTSVAGKLVRDTNGESDPFGDDERERLAQHELARQLAAYLNKLTVISDLQDPRPDLFYLRVVGYDEGLTDPVLGEMIDLAAEREPDAVIAAFEDETPEIKTLAARLLINDLAHQRGIGQANVLESACRLVAQLPQHLVDEVAHLAPEVLTHIGDSSWRDAAIPGAAFLATNTNAVEELAELLEPLDPTEDHHDDLLTACTPALAWASDDAAEPIHEKIATFLPTSSQPLEAAVSNLPAQPASRLWNSIRETVSVEFGNGDSDDSLALFERLAEAVLDNEQPRSLTYSLILTGLGRTIPEITAYVHSQRDVLLPPLSADQQALIALFVMRTGDPSDWNDWLAYLSNDIPPTELISDWATSTAKTVIASIPTERRDLAPVFDPVFALITKSEHQAQLPAAIAERVAAIEWADDTDPESIRWQNLRHITAQTSPNEEATAEVAQAIADSLLAALARRLSTATTAIPTNLFSDWRARINELPSDQRKALDAQLSELTAPNTSAAVSLLRLRIAARRGHGIGPLTPAVLLPLVSETSASIMAGEWLTLRPRVEQVVEVHRAIPIGTGPLSRYAVSLNASRRTALWIALEKDSASREHLQAVGTYGVGGLAITHMRSAILDQPQQRQRDAATNRLLLATFAEAPSKVELDRGEKTGHKEASGLALDLIDTDINDNIILAARLVIHSGGYAHGTKTRLRTAFTKFGNGRQSRNFTSSQAEALRALELYVPNKKSRWARLLDAVT